MEISDNTAQSITNIAPQSKLHKERDSTILEQTKFLQASQVFQEEEKLETAAFQDEKGSRAVKTIDANKSYSNDSVAEQNAIQNQRNISKIVLRETNNVFEYEKDKIDSHRQTQNLDFTFKHAQNHYEEKQGKLTRSRQKKEGTQKNSSIELLDNNAQVQDQQNEESILQIEKANQQAKNQIVLNQRFSIQAIERIDKSMLQSQQSESVIHSQDKIIFRTQQAQTMQIKSDQSQHYENDTIPDVKERESAIIYGDSKTKSLLQTQERRATQQVSFTGNLISSTRFKEQKSITPQQTKRKSNQDTSDQVTLNSKNIGDYEHQNYNFKSQDNFLTAQNKKILQHKRRSQIGTAGGASDKQTEKAQMSYHIEDSQNDIASHSAQIQDLELAQPSIVRYEEEIKSQSDKTVENLIDQHNPAEVRRKALKPGDDDYIYYVEQEVNSNEQFEEDKEFEVQVKTE